MTREELGSATERRDNQPPLGLAEDSRDDTRKPITQIYLACPEVPHEVPDVEDLEPGHSLHAPDGRLYN